MKENITDKKWFLYVLVVIAATMWGMSYFGTKVALESLEPMQILTLRWTISTAVFFLLAVLKIIKVNFKGKPIKILLIVGAIQPCLYSVFETMGINFTTTSESSIFIATIPIFVLILGSIIFKVRPTKRTVLAVVIAFIGVATCIVFAPGFSVGGKGLGYIMLIGAVLSGAVYSHVSNRAAKNFNTIELTFGIATMGGIFFNIINFSMGYGFSTYTACIGDMKLTVAILFLGICCSAICYIVYNFALAKLPAAIATNIMANLNTVVGVLSGILFAGDDFGWYIIIGLALTLCGIGITTLEGNKA